jgi:hypothetical protein
MNRGASLIEVLVALCICMFVFSAALRLSVFTVRSESCSESLTYASIFGHTKLSSLTSLPMTSHDLELRWHRDPENPIRKGGISFYRFWKVDETDLGRRVVLYMAWDDSFRARAADFITEGELAASRCPRISFIDVILRD